MFENKVKYTLFFAEKLIYIIFVMIMCLIFASCQDTNVDERIKNNIEKNYLLETFEDTANDIGYYATYNQEMEYSSTSGKDFKGILSYDYYYYNNHLNNDKYYFDVEKYYTSKEMSRTVNMVSYIDLDTGNKYYICPDPLCSHNLPEECEYVGFHSTGFFNDTNIFYTWRIDLLSDNSRYFTIYKADSSKNEVIQIYRCAETTSKNFFYIKNIYKDKLYFQEYTRVEDRSTKKSKKDISALFYINLNNDTVEKIGDLPEHYDDKNANIFYVNNDSYYFTSVIDIFTTDLSFKNEKSIYTLQDNEKFGKYYYDENIDSLFFNIFNQKGNYGYIYEYSQNGNLTKLDIPSENIYYFQLTNRKIYYSEYEPLYYGKSPMGGEVYDYTGGKIYVTDRYVLGKSELIYSDNTKNFMIATDAINGYVIIGDYLYFDYYKIELENGFATPSYSGKKIRINLNENTLKYISFD